MLEKITGIKREYWFIFFFLVGSLLFFDLVGVNYSGITGAQTALGDSQISNIARTFEGLYRLIFEGFLLPFFSVVDKDGVLTARILIAIFLFFLLKTAFSKSERFGKSGNVLAAVLSLVVAAFIPGNILNAYFGTGGAIRDVLGLSINIALIGLFLYGMHRWEVKSRGESMLKGSMYIIALLIFLYTFGVLLANAFTSGGAIRDVSVLFSSIVYLICIILAFYHILFGGPSKEYFTQNLPKYDDRTNLGNQGGQSDGGNATNRLQNMQQNIQQRRQQNPQQQAAQQAQQNTLRSTKKNLLSSITSIDQACNPLITGVNALYNQFARTAPNTRMPQRTISDISSNIKPIIRDLTWFEGNANTLPNNLPQKQKILALIKVITQVLSYVNNDLGRGITTYEQLLKRIDNPKNFIPQRVGYIRQYIQQIKA